MGAGGAGRAGSAGRSGIRCGGSRRDPGRVGTVGQERAQRRPEGLEAFVWRPRFQTGVASWRRWLPGCAAPGGVRISACGRLGGSGPPPAACAGGPGLPRPARLGGGETRPSWGRASCPRPGASGESRGAAGIRALCDCGPWWFSRSRSDPGEDYWRRERSGAECGGSVGRVNLLKCRVLPAASCVRGSRSRKGSARLWLTELLPRGCFGGAPFSPRPCSEVRVCALLPLERACTRIIWRQLLC